MYLGCGEAGNWLALFATDHHERRDSKADVADLLVDAMDWLF